MRYERRHRWVWWLLMVSLLVLMVMSCTKTMVANLPDKSGVRVHLDWDGQEIPPGMKFYFYPAEGESVGLIHSETSATGYEGELAVGRYRILAHSTQASGVSFSGMESYSTATVSANSLSTRADGVTLISQPALLHAGTMSDVLEVLRFAETARTVTPRLLTKTLKITFNTDKLPGVSSVEGELRGLFSSVLLATGEATEIAREQAPRVGAPFATVINAATATATISYFGMLSPEKGEAYQNEMPLTLKGDDGWQQITRVDMSQVLTDIASQEQGGGLEFEIEDEIKIDIEPTPTGLSAYVLSWTRYGGGEGDIYYIIY